MENNTQETVTDDNTITSPPPAEHAIDKIVEHATTETLHGNTAIIQQFTTTIGGGDPMATPIYPIPAPDESQGASPRPVKHRPTFTEDQIATMEAIFKHRQYLSPVERESVATAIGLTAQQVRVWFQNRRQKVKQFLSVKQQQEDETAATGMDSPAKDKSDSIEGSTALDIHALLSQAQKSTNQIDPQLLQMLFPKMTPNEPTTDEKEGEGDKGGEEGSPPPQSSPSMGVVSSNGTITISPQALLCLTPLLLATSQSEAKGEKSDAHTINAVQLMQTLSAVSSRLPNHAPSGKTTTPTPLRAQSPVPVEDTLTDNPLPAPSTSGAAGLLSSEVLQQILSAADKSKAWTLATTPTSSLPPSLSLSLSSSAGRTARKKRQVFSGHQIAEMEKRFEKSPYIDNKEREVLAQEIGLQADQVKVWFQNRRTKKTRLSWRQGKEGED